LARGEQRHLFCRTQALELNLKALLVEVAFFNAGKNARI